MPIAKLLFLSFALLSTLSHGEEERTSLKDLKPQWLTDQVSILFFPNKWHNKLQVGDTTYTRFEHTTHRDYADLERAAKMDRVGYFKFGIKVTTEELSKIKELAENDWGEFNCTMGACKPIIKGCNMFMPFPTNITPLANALYLSLSRALPGTRVVSVRFLGSKSKLLTTEGVGMTLLESVPYLLVGTGLGYVLFPLAEDEKQENRREWEEGRQEVSPEENPAPESQSVL